MRIHIYTHTNAPYNSISCNLTAFDRTKAITLVSEQQQHQLQQREREREQGRKEESSNNSLLALSLSLVHHTQLSRHNATHQIVAYQFYLNKCAALNFTKFGFFYFTCCFDFSANKRTLNDLNCAYVTRNWYG